MATENELTRAKDTLKRHIFGMPGVTGVGIGEGVVRVYLTSAEAGAIVPREVDGIPVECIVTGDIIADCE
ncbi:MAG TPA: hypothetical protein VEK79_03760 [Thermoanaerobaculia bacterium]|nr:hypothetical protein [Thermoanaerobaculia bacterium]